MATGKMSTTQKLPFTIAPADVNGSPRDVENLQGEVLNGGDLTFDITDNKSGFVVSGSTLGTFQIKFKADARIGDGEVIIEETHDIIIENPEATTLGGTFGSPVPK